MKKFHCAVAPDDFVGVVVSDSYRRVKMQMNEGGFNKFVFLSVEDAKKLRRELKKIIRELQGEHY